jgi:hypothetical protein
MAHSELRDLLQQKSEIMKRVGSIKQMITGLASLFGDEVLTADLMGLLDRGSPSRQPGFTRTCRQALMESNRPLLAHEVCREIERRDPTLLARHKDPVASVTTVLNRLANYGEARYVVSDRGRRRSWSWVTQSETDSATTLRGNQASNEPELSPSLT